MYINRLYNNRFVRDEAPADGGDGGSGNPSPSSVTLGDTTAAPASSSQQEDQTASATTEVDFSHYLDEGADQSAYRKAMGIPEQLADYTLTFSDGFQLPTPTASWLQQAGHELGIAPGAAARLAEGYAAHYQDLAAAEQAERSQQMIQALQREWGVDYQARFEGAAKTAKSLCASAGIDDSFLSDPAIGGHPGVIKLMDTISQMRREAKAAGLNMSIDMQGGAGECRRIESDPSHPLHEAYINPDHPNHKHANDVYDRHMLTGR